MTKQERIQTYRDRVQAISKLDPTTSITLKDIVYTLEFDNDAVFGLFKETGLNILTTPFTTDEAAKDIQLVPTLLYWGLKKHHPDLTRESLGGMVSFRHYSYICAALGTALNIYMPDLSDLPPIEESAGGEGESEDPTQTQKITG